jgi:hypothetical protein
MIIHKLKQDVIKYSSINIGIYIINRFLLSIFTVPTVLQILGFGIIFVLMDSFVLHHDYKLLEINYKNQLDRCEFNRDLNLIKQKLDLLLENNTQKSSVIEFEIKSLSSQNITPLQSPNINYEMAKQTFKQKSYSFNVKPPKKPSDEIPITTAGEVITLSVKK